MTFKQVIIIRKDLKMDSGKIVSQGSHASLGSFLIANSRIRKVWLKEGGKKVVLKVGGLKDLNVIRKKAAAAKLPNFVVRDAGLTQIKKGTVTCIGIGPTEEEEIDKITKDLKLL